MGATCSLKSCPSFWPGRRASVPGGMGMGPGGGMGSGMGMGSGGGMGGMGGLGGGMGVGPGLGQGSESADSSAQVPGKGAGAASVPGRDELATSVPGSESAYSLFSVDSPAAVDMGPDYGYSRIRIHRKDDLSPYAQSQDARFAMDVRKRNCILVAVAAFVALCAAIVLPDITFDQVSILGYRNFARWAEYLVGNVRTLAGMISFSGVSLQSVSWEAKISQYLICALAGAGLAVTGAMFQGALKNAMVSPSTLGVMSGAQIGSILYILLGFYTPVISGAMSMSDYTAYLESMSIFEYIWYLEAQSIFSLAGAFAAVMIVLGISYAVGRGKVSRSALVIVGSVFASVISGIVQFIRYYIVEFGTEAEYNAISSLATGSLSGWFQALDVVLAGVPIVICLAVLMKMRNRMNLLAFNDDEARSMGLSPQVSRVVTIAVCTILTAVIVAFCGAVNMVGFLVPLLVRKVSGPDFRYLVPTAMFAGALVTILANFFSNQFVSGVGMGTITGIIGAVVFVVTVVRQRRRGDVDWV